ncbi:MAG: hypothetical protein E6X85_06130 [Veillonella sp.]|nr:hypothetical protein [Veillonella sp.]
MEIILKILTLIMFIGILYNSRQRKKYDEWKEKENQAIYDLGQILVCDRAQAKFVIDQLGRHAVPIDVVVEPMSVVSIHGESMNGYAFSYNELRGYFTLNDKFEITNLIYNDVDLLHQGVFAL